MNPLRLSNSVGLLLCMFAALVFAACGSDDSNSGGGTTAADAGAAADSGGGGAKTPTFAEVYDKVLKPKCAICHGEKHDTNMALGTTVDSAYTNVTTAKSANKCSESTYVTAGDSAKSLLFLKIDPAAKPACGAIMPPGGAMDAALVALVKDWIDAGAKK